MKRMAIAFLTCAAVASGALKKPVRVETGLLAGVAAKDAAITVFRGVPYAAPPVGSRRWRAPAAPARWSGVRVADRFGANCMQTIVEEKKPWTHEFMAHGEVSEDCLFLNIWTGADSIYERRPVLVYLHGGANYEGSGSVDAYNGEGLAKKGLVVVTVNYRLGIFGFFTHPELSKESGHGSGNYGLLDEMAALRWVKKNIAAFGGNSTRVTVAGQSAGAFDISCLIGSPMAAGLFERAVMESGGVTGGGALKALSAAEEDGVQFATPKGAHALSELRAMSARDLFAPAPGSPRFGPVTDGYVIVPGAKINDVVVLAGSNADENGASPQGKPEANDAARAKARTALIQWAAARKEAGQFGAFLYFWNHVLPGPDAARYGTFHTSEVPYVFNSLDYSDRPFTDDDRKIADMVSSYWARFAATGDPNGKGLPYWPSSNEQPTQVMQLGDETKPIPAQR